MERSCQTTDRILLSLIGIVLLLMVANLGLFYRMNQLQSLILETSRGGSQTPKLSSSPIGENAPNFTLSDTTGQKVTLSEYRGKPVMLIFSSTTCPVCQQMYPALTYFHKQNPNVVMLLLSYGSEVENQQMKREQNFEFPVLTLSGQEDVLMDYGLTKTPTFYLLDAEGKISQTGYSLEYMEKQLQQSEG